MKILRAHGCRVSPFSFYIIDVRDRKSNLIEKGYIYNVVRNNGNRRDDWKNKSRELSGAMQMNIFQFSQRSSKQWKLQDSVNLF